MGKDSMKFMQTYQDSLETMNHEAVEYIRGISVVKVFGQTVQSITKFNDAIKSYRKFALAYTMSCKKGMVAFNSVINSSFLVLVPTSLIIGFVSSDLIGFMQSFLFYVIFSPACAVIQYRISATVTGSTLLKKNALIASLLVIGKTSFRSSIIQDAGSCAQRLSMKFIPVHVAAVVPVPLQRSAAHPHFA